MVDAASLAWHSSGLLSRSTASRTAACMCDTLSCASGRGPAHGASSCPHIAWPPPPHPTRMHACMPACLLARVMPADAGAGFPFSHGEESSGSRRRTPRGAGRGPPPAHTRLARLPLPRCFGTGLSWGVYRCTPAWQARPPAHTCACIALTRCMLPASSLCVLCPDSVPSAPCPPPPAALPARPTTGPRQPLAGVCAARRVRHLPQQGPGAVVRGRSQEPPQLARVPHAPVAAGRLAAAAGQPAGSPLPAPEHQGWRDRGPIEPGFGRFDVLLPLRTQPQPQSKRRRQPQQAGHP